MNIARTDDTTQEQRQLQHTSLSCLSPCFDAKCRTQGLVGRNSLGIREVLQRLTKSITYAYIVRGKCTTRHLFPKLQQKRQLLPSSLKHNITYAWGLLVVWWWLHLKAHFPSTSSSHDDFFAFRNEHFQRRTRGAPERKNRKEDSR